MNRAYVRLGAALITISVLAAGCGGGSDPTPEPALPTVVEDAAPAQEPTTGFGGVVNQAKEVADDMNARTDALLGN